MLESLNQYIIRCSFSFWKILLIFIGFAGSLRALMFIGDKFAINAGGHLPFDLQNSLTTEQMFIQLTEYTPQAVTLYYVFTAVDYFFPLLAGLFLATIWAFVLRHTLPRWYEIGLQKNLFLLLLVPALLDWLENILLLSAILMWPETPQNVAEAAVTAKQAKLATTLLAQGSTALIILTGLFIWARNRLKG